MNPGLRIRRGCPEDIDQVYALNRSSFPEAWSRQGLADALSHGYDLLVAVVGEHADFAGYLLSHDILDQTHILQVAVSPTIQRQGIARALTETLIGNKRTCGQKEMLLEVRLSNLAARQLYGALGFEQAGIRPGYYATALVGTGREDALLMDLILKP